MFLELQQTLLLILFQIPERSTHLQVTAWGGPHNRGVSHRQQHSLASSASSFKLWGVHLHNVRQQW